MSTEQNGKQIVQQGANAIMQQISEQERKRKEMVQGTKNFGKQQAFNKVKKDIDSLSKNYDEAYNKAYTGRQSIVQKANELKVLGVKETGTYPIPEAQYGLEEE